MHVIQRKLSHAFFDGAIDRELKQHFLMGGDGSFNEAFSQALNLEAAKEAAGPSSRLRKVTRVPVGIWSPPA
jgi:hypothetical protein